VQEDEMHANLPQLSIWAMNQNVQNRESILQKNVEVRLFCTFPASGRQLACEYAMYEISGQDSQRLMEAQVVER